jgi:hypothetical protein
LLLSDVPAALAAGEEEHVPGSEHGIEVVIRLRSDVAQAARGNATAPASAAAAAGALQQRVRRFGGDLRPQHLASADPGLAGYFVASVASASAAECLAAEIRSLDGVEAAYVKPPPAMP